MVFHYFFVFFIHNGMYFDYVGTKVYYKFSKRQENPVLLLLHGWGGNVHSFDMLGDLKKEFRVLEVDFPPFGKSEEGQDWSVFLYANMLISLCEKLNIEKCHILGHSFGGRIAILLGAIKKDLAQKIVLVGCAGMKPRRSLGYHIKVAIYKTKKRLGRDISNYGSKDFLSLSPNMKKTFLKIVNTHLEEYAKMLNGQVLIVYGDKDKETPLYMGKRLNKLIKNSSLVVMRDCSHFCYNEKPFEFCKLVEKFLKG